LEQAGPLPEILVLGNLAVYQVLYQEDGAAEGAILATDRETVDYWAAVTEQLYGQGEDIDSFFQREVFGLRPPSAV
jgi:hypothetical protein